MKTLAAEMDFAKDELRLFGGNTAVPMQVNTAGQYMIPMTEFPVQQPLSKMMEKPATTVMAIESDDPEPASELPSTDGECNTASVPSDAVPVPREGVVMSHNGDVTIVGKRGKTKDYWVIKPTAREVIRVHIKPRAERFTPCHAHCPVLPEELSSDRITRWNVVGSSEPTCELRDQWTDPAHAHDHLPLPDGNYWVGETVFQMAVDATMPAGTDHETLMTQWTPKQSRQLAQQVGKLEQFRKPKKPFDVIEVFSPPRFAQQTATRGQTCLSADLVTGWDFRKPSHREHMKKLIKETPPELLVLCPPCTWAGGWFNLNQLYMSPEEVAEKQRLTMLFINFCCELMELQLASGNRVLFEHPKGSAAWKMPKVQKLVRRMHEVECDMCRFQLRIPKGRLIRKSTKLLVSHANMKSLNRKCPGRQHPDHRDHHVVAGSHPQVGSVSRFAGQYAQSFVRAVMNCCPNLRISPVLSVACDKVVPARLLKS